MLRQLSTFFLLATWLAGVVCAQQARKPLDSWARETWSQQNGLRSDQVNALAQTPDGYMWIGTPEGLARFNGFDFSYNDSATIAQLHDNDVRSLAIGHENSLLIGTARGGISFLNQGWWTQRGSDSGLVQNGVVAAQEDGHGRLWVATAGGLDVFDGRRKLHFDSRNGLPSDRVASLLVADDGSAWVGTSAGLARIVNDRVQTISVNAGLLPSGAITALAEAQDRSIWVGTRAGAYRQRRGEVQFEKMTTDVFDDVVLAILPDSASRALVGTSAHGLLVVNDGRSEAVREPAAGHAWSVDALMRAADGSIWVGGNQGLMRLRNTPFGAIGKQEGLRNDNVQAVLETPDGDVWIGTQAGLARMHDGDVEPVDEATFASQSIRALARSADRGVWVGTDADGAQRVTNGTVDRIVNLANGLPSDAVRAIREDRDGNLWIGTAKGLFWKKGGSQRVYTVADGLPGDGIYGLFQDAGGRLWVGTGNGMAYLDGERFVAIPMPTQSMAQTVFAFAADGDGAVWVATDRGLLRWKDGHLAAINGAQGLDAVYAVLPDREGNLWLSTLSGLVRVTAEQANATADGRRKSMTMDVFGAPDGLPSSQCNGGSSPGAWLLSDGSVWVAMSRGVGMVRPERLADYRNAPPQTQLEEVRIDDRIVAPGDGVLDLPPGARKIDVRYFAMNYHLPRRIQYRYLLDGYDTDWSVVGEHTSVQFTNLPPGNYRLRIQAAVTGGSWSPREADLSFRIQARIWQKPWFYVLATLALLVVGWLAYRARIRVLAANERHLQKLVDARTEDLRRQTELLRQADADKTQLLETIQAQAEAFERQAREDALTGIANRRRVDEAIEVYFAESRRSRRPLSLVLLDIDHFKRVNDHYSHAVGDDVLRALGGILRGHQRPGDLAGRLGGEEFVCILSGSDIAGARTYCERMRAAIEAHDWSAIAQGLRVTVSMGVVQWDGTETYSRMSSRADALLYRAKAGGRNRVEG
ncbi:MAG: diguanylate cyclase [Proteobacteria bacterium]|nr:diguanylate cyclase [Pseudomonadota bacterium]